MRVQETFLDKTFPILIVNVRFQEYRLLTIHTVMFSKFNLNQAFGESQCIGADFFFCLPVDAQTFVRGATQNGTYITPNSLQAPTGDQCL